MRPGGYFCIFVTKCIVMKNIFSLTITGVLLLAVSLFFFGCEKEVIPPKPAFTYTPGFPESGDIVTFNASLTTAGSCSGCKILEYYWNFDYNPQQPDAGWNAPIPDSIMTKQFTTSDPRVVALKVRNNHGYYSVEPFVDTIIFSGSSGNNPPSKPAVISPDNGALGVSQLPELRWSSIDSDEDNLTFDIYLSVSSPPGQIKQNHTSTTFQVSDSLAANTTYYWQVVAKDGFNNVASSVWSFTTGGTGPGVNLPPNKPTDPYPAPFEQLQPLNTTMSWACSDPNMDDLTYTIYFGTSADPLPSMVETGYRTTSYTYDQTLQPETTYYWKIVASDGQEETEGELWQFQTGNNSLICPDSITDVREGIPKTYNVEQIGNQCWMAENLDFGAMITGEPTNNQQTEKFCYGDDQDNCDSYGALYNWNEMMIYTHVEEVGGICPEGWHIPSETEWQRLVNQAGGVFSAGTTLQPSGTTGFDALLGGYRQSDGVFSQLSLQGYYWSSTELDDTKAWLILFDKNSDAVFYSHQEKMIGASLRCVKD